MAFDCFKKKVEEESPVKTEKEPVPLPAKNMSIVRYPRCNREWVLGYQTLWNNTSMRPEYQSQVEASVRQCLAGKAAYQKVSAKVGIPWEVIAAIHKMEAGCDFKGCLHNGERIIGTGRKTTLVPKGRGPFATWEESAIDAINSEHKIPAGYKFDIANTLYYLEMFNGFGYRNRGVNSAYLWSYTNNYSRGKFISDGVWSATAVSKQCGAVPILKSLGFVPETWV